MPSLDKSINFIWVASLLKGYCLACFSDVFRLHLLASLLVILGLFVSGGIGSCEPSGRFFASHPFIIRFAYGFLVFLIKTIMSLIRYL